MTHGSATSAGAGERGSAPSGTIPRRKFVILFLLIYLVHQALVIVACPPDALLGNRPYGKGDFHTHFQQTHTIGEALTRFGKTWAYDPNMLAGFPAGLFFDVDNKAYCLFTHALTRLGLDQVRAFNLFPLLVALLAPLGLWAAARLQRVSHRAQLFVLGLAVLVWHFDSAMRFFWAGGMTSFAAASVGSVVVFFLFARMLDRGRPRFYVPLLLLLPLVILTHVWAFVILVVPLLGLYALRWRRLKSADHLRVWTVALAGLLGNAFWLWPAITHWDLIAPSAVLFQATPIYFLSDYLGIVTDPPMALQTTYRYLALVGLGLTLWSWRRRGDDRLAGGALAAGWLLVLTYVGAWVPLLKQTEPYRFVGPTMLMALALAGPGLERAISRATWRGLGQSGKALVLILALLLLPRALQDVLFFVPELAPHVTLGALHTESGTVAPRPGTLAPFRLEGTSREHLLVARYLELRCKEEGRLLVQEWTLAETLRWAIRRPVLGGLADRRSIHQEANLFRRLDDPRLHGQALADYLRRYNVRYVLLSRPHPVLEARGDLFTLLEARGQYRLLRATHRGDYFVRGSGRVSAGLNRLELSDLRPGRDPRGREVAEIRFHHLEDLRCSPGCQVERAPLAGAAAGFVRVVGQPSLARRVVVEMAY